jgi:hypothetical protein
LTGSYRRIGKSKPHVEAPDGTGEVEGLSGSVERRSKLNRVQRKETENRKEGSFTLYSDGRQPERASGTTDEPPDWNTQGPKLYGSVERATRRKA